MDSRWGNLHISGTYPFQLSPVNLYWLKCTSKFVLCSDDVNCKFTMSVVYCESLLDREEIRSSDDHVMIHISSELCHRNKTTFHFILYLCGCVPVQQWGCVDLNVAAAMNSGVAFSPFPFIKDGLIFPILKEIRWEALKHLSYHLENSSIS